MRYCLVVLALSCGCSTMNGASASTEVGRGTADAAHFAAHTDERTPQDAALDAAREAVRRSEAAQPRLREPCAGWALWQAYAEHFIASDGRVIDHTSGGRSTSEGQSYALFFALVAGDRARFTTVLDWTERNLAQGNLQQHLPAWHWGTRSDGSWGVVDPNAASDADVWLAYTLLEAARLWSVPYYRVLASALARQIVQHEVVQAEGLGQVLLPGPRGFVEPGGALRLNPSYLVVPLFRRFERAGIAGPWPALIASSTRILARSAPRGLAPDWVSYAPPKGFVDDPVTGAAGSYDAVRVYMWSTFVAQSEPAARVLRQSSDGLLTLLDGAGKMPERIDVRTAEVSSTEGPAGFLAVALAYAHARGDSKLADALRERLTAQRAPSGLYGAPPAYYDQNLALFALGFVEGRYQFEGEGSLRLLWNEVVCASQ